MVVAHIKVIIQAIIFIFLLITASVIDIRKRIVPNILPMLIFCIGLLTFTPYKLFGILLGLPLLIGALFADSNQIGGIGGGDIKFSTSCGFILGISAGIVGLIIGLSIFCLWFLILKLYYAVLYKKQLLANQTSLPMIPFLSVGFIVAYFINLYI